MQALGYRDLAGRAGPRLVDAAGSAITQVRITTLLDSIFYACVVVRGADGPREVDARPSDAVNLALVSGAPIWLNSELFGVRPPANFDYPAASALPVATADIAAQAWERMQEQSKRYGPLSGQAPDDAPA